MTLDGVLFDITLVAAGNCMYATVSANGTVMASGSKCTSSCPLMPYPWMEGSTGNFLFKTSNEELPWYENFNTDQGLYYLSAAELATLRG